ncbi:hypothetical protein EVAR_6012_1 [Eumeta japonica]|uniref:Uncharacterized protein n=1 Tax=Eumeta variegata TaxID=151549 RepID=A0A4C1TAK4_EUMVA|nr:hypothetical protein EVAR_6012_1 [Eumeta japonica]
MKASEQINYGAGTPAADETKAMQVDDIIVSLLSVDCIDVDIDVDYVRPPIIKDTFSDSKSDYVVLQKRLYFPIKLEQKHICIGRESNPGRPRGKRAFYH